MYAFPVILSVTTAAIVPVVASAWIQSALTNDTSPNPENSRRAALSTVGAEGLHGRDWCY